MEDYYAMRTAVFHEIRQYCSAEFFMKYGDKIYKCYRKEYEPYFGERAFGYIKEIVQEFKDMFGEE